jgi:hypothetical protein
MTLMARHAWRWCSALVLVAIFSTGCASVRPAATTLASEGGTATRTIEAAFAKTQADLDLMIDRRIMQAALTGRNPPSQQALQDIARVQRAMTARRNLCGNLATLYDSFAALAAYDASSEVTTAFSQVTASTNELAQAVGSTAPVSTAMNDLAGRLAGAAATALQNAKLRRTSAVIRESLSVIRGLLAEEAPLHTSVRGELVRIAGATSFELFRSGIGRPHPLLREMLDSREFSYDEKQANLTLDRGPRSKDIQDGIQGIIQRRVHRRLELESAVVAGFASVLTQLEQEHRAFEAEQPLDPRGVAERLAAFREIVDLITEVRRERADQPETRP